MTLTLRIVDCTFLIFIESANIRDVAVIVIIDIVIPRIVPYVVLMVHPGLINSSIQHHDVTPEEIV